ncbi:helix-turn-helix domain-containing protein [Aminipila butyrica]|uniref:Helix-turn-helix domain-containing protein n=1 Tax=Aminipila butyrica TaxID=433296 RepID=A0A858BYK9_9FIRM|nr:helix-turn-helix domain-containing protein [Aminipila butyrica]QIB70215.1 helix-turn-helix domain-containing protein [Aminipila butyrica]
MNENMAECVANPTKCKLLLEIYSKGQATAKQLTDTYSDITHATLYRYLKKMTADGILKVVAENQIRGTVERVYAVADDLLMDMQRMVEENNGPAYMMLFTKFVMGLTEEFRQYTSRSDINLLQDGSGFSVAPIYATTEELTAALTEMGKIIEPLLTNEKTPERDLHNIAIITTPPKKEKK